MSTQPTDLPAGHRRTLPVKLAPTGALDAPAPAAPLADGDLVAPNGRVWRRTEYLRADAPLYVIDGVDPKECPRLMMSTEAELVQIFGSSLERLDGAA